MSIGQAPEAAPRVGKSGAPDVGPHLVQFYERDAFLVMETARFIGAGLGAGEAAVLIATRPHLDRLEVTLAARGVRLDLARAQRRYVELDAAETLAQILIDGAPDPVRFADVVGETIERAAERHARVRTFGEMVALLWAEGRQDAALALEQLWNDLVARLPLSLLCAYPLTTLTDRGDDARVLEICGAHSHVIPADSYTMLDSPDDRMREIVQLQQRAGALDAEIAERTRLAAIVESSNDGIISTTLDGIVTSWNRGAEHLFGYTAEEMVGQPIARLLPTDRPDDDLAATLATTRRGERIEHFETQRVRKDGRRIHVSLTLSPIRDAAGNVIGASKIARDVTERKRAEDALRESRAMLDSLNQIGQALSAELDLHKLLQAITDAATRLTHAKFGAFFYNAIDDHGGHYLLYTLSGAPREAFEKFGMPRNTALFATTYAGEAVVRLDDVTQDPRYGKSPPHYGMPPGHLPVTSYLAVPLVGRSGEVFGGVFLGHPEPGVFTEDAERVVVGFATQAAIAIDNARLYDAERRSRRAAEAANRAKDEFLAMLGHELRNPLSVVRNAALTASLDPARRERALNIVHRGTDQLAQLIDDLIDVARIAHGKITLRAQRLRVAGIAERAVESTQRLVADRAHHLSLSLPADDLEVEGDATRLEQVIVNLISNAAKYTPPGGRIEIGVAREGAEAVLRVRDNGVGIAPEQLPHIFDLFAQADPGVARAHGGLGIGLTVVRQLVELHGGRVEAHSDGSGQGAEFVVRLPVLPHSVERTAASPLEDRMEEQGARLVLVVEDNADAAEALTMLLEVLGHRVRAVHDGATALDVAQASPPDVMLVDIGLPGIDGYEVARRVREDARLNGVLLVALTGYGQEEDRQRTKAAGFDHHFTKPVEPDALNRLVTGLPRAKP